MILLRTRMLLVSSVVALAALSACTVDQSASKGEVDDSLQGVAPSTAIQASPTAGGIRFSARGISFETPEGWTDLDAGELAEGVGDSEEATDVADRLGIDATQFEKLVASLDLFIIDTAGGTQGFVDNINLLTVPGIMPNDTQLKLQFAALGADVSEVEHVSTKLGGAAKVTYDVEMGSVLVHGSGIFFAGPDGLMNLTVSTADEALTARLVAGVLESLQASA